MIGIWQNSRVSPGQDCRWRRLRVELMRLDVVARLFRPVGLGAMKHGFHARSAARTKARSRLRRGFTAGAARRRGPHCWPPDPR